ncbi:hypothetical protein [Corallococcus sp. 4LFB]|uniref:hypothetical protein n=1 Tax=Corallococcus sp. 4LFB TaxID=3383249 RepID=UPI0039747370
MDEATKEKLQAMAKRARRLLKVVEEAVGAGAMAQQVDYTLDLAVDQVACLTRDIKAEVKRETEAKA